MKQFPTTRAIRELLSVTNALYEARALVMRPVGFIFKRYDGRAVADVTKAYTEARLKLWDKIYATYPEIDKEGVWICSGDYITKDK